MKICRESYSDYEAAAERINSQYDLAILNFKLGACSTGWLSAGHKYCHLP